MKELRGYAGWVQRTIGLPRSLTFVMAYWMTALGVVYVIQPEAVRERTALYRVLVNYMEPEVWGVLLAMSGALMLFGAFRNRVWWALLGAFGALGMWSFSFALYIVDWPRSWPQVFTVGLPIWLLLVLTVNVLSVASAPPREVEGTFDEG